MKIIYYTHCGRKHSINQDGIFIQGYGVRHTATPQALLMPNGCGLFMVVDGVGGACGGSHATGLILKSLAGAHVPAEPDCEAIHHIIYRAAHELRHEAWRKTELANMCAVCAGVWLCGASAFFFNCGDCRVYLSRAGDLSLLTRDHSIAGQMLDDGLIDRDDMRFFPDNRLLTSISAQPLLPEIYCETAPMGKGGIVLLCSDGVWSCFSFGELAEIICRGIHEAAEILARAARTSDDDYSFILLECQALV